MPRESPKLERISLRPRALLQLINSVLELSDEPLERARRVKPVGSVAEDVIQRLALPSNLASARSYGSRANSRRRLNAPSNISASLWSSSSGTNAIVTKSRYIPYLRWSREPFPARNRPEPLIGEVSKDWYI